MRTLVLASTSPYRRQLLEQLQLPFVAAAPRFEETIEQGVAPGLLVKHLAVGKAESLAPYYPDALIVGADQVFVDPRNRILGKPGDAATAEAQLLAMAGKTHTFFTGVAVHDSLSGETIADYSTFTVTLRHLDQEQIHSYVEREKPVDCAGSFKIEGLGIALMDAMEGEDYTSLIGLPLIKLVRILEQFGVEIL